MRTFILRQLPRSAILLSLVASACGAGRATTSEPDAETPAADAADPAVLALPVCTAPVSQPPAIRALVPQGGSWGTGPHVFSLVTRTATGWTLAVESGSTPAPASVEDPDELLAGLAAGDRFTVDGVTQCASFSGCKHYDVVRNAGDGTLIAASYDHDSAIDAFAALLGVAVSLEPDCRMAELDACYTGAIVVQNRLRFGDDPALVAAGGSGSIQIGAQTVRVAAGGLVTLSGGAPSRCTDAGSFWRGEQSFTLAR